MSAAQDLRELEVRVLRTIRTRAMCHLLHGACTLPGATHADAVAILQVMIDSELALEHGDDAALESIARRLVAIGVRLDRLARTASAA